MSAVGQDPTYAGPQTLSLYIVSEEKQEQSLVAKGEVTAFIRPTDVVEEKTGQEVWCRRMSFKLKKKKQWSSKQGGDLLFFF